MEVRISSVRECDLSRKFQVSIPADCGDDFRVQAPQFPPDIKQHSEAM